MKQKILSLSLILIIVCSIGACSKNAETTQTQKQSITIKVVAESKNFAKDVQTETDKTTLGDLLNELEIATFTNSTYGRYITGFYDIVADEGNQEWWSVLVNGDFAQTGVDDITINTNDVYTFELKVGY